MRERERVSNELQYKHPYCDGVGNRVSIFLQASFESVLILKGKRIFGEPDLSESSLFFSASLSNSLIDSDISSYRKKGKDMQSKCIFLYTVGFS